MLNLGKYATTPNQQRNTACCSTKIKIGFFLNFFQTRSEHPQRFALENPNKTLKRKIFPQTEKWIEVHYFGPGAFIKIRPQVWCRRLKPFSCSTAECVCFIKTHLSPTGASFDYRDNSICKFYVVEGMTEILVPKKAYRAAAKYSGSK